MWSVVNKSSGAYWLSLSIRTAYVLHHYISADYSHYLSFSWKLFNPDVKHLQSREKSKHSFLVNQYVHWSPDHRLPSWHPTHRCSRAGWEMLSIQQVQGQSLHLQSSCGLSEGSVIPQDPSPHYSFQSGDFSHLYCWFFQPDTRVKVTAEGGDIRIDARIPVLL